MATVTRTVNAWRTDGIVSNPDTTYYDGSWSSSNNGYSVISSGWFDGASRYFTMSYRISGGDAGVVSGINFSLNVSSVSNTGTLTACLYDSEPVGEYRHPTDYLQNQIKSVSASTTNVAFSFSNLQIDATKPLYVVVFADEGSEDYIRVEAQCTATVTANTTLGLVVTAVSPKNTTRTASSSMSYTWSVSGSTTQTKAELYINGTLRETVNGSSTSVYSSYRPPAGTVSWYVKVTNNLGVVSRSDTATFTIQYVSISYLAPYNSKTSGSINRFAAQTFTVQMQANGTPYTDYSVVDPVFYWRQSGESTWNSIQMTREYVGSTYKRATVTIPANTLPKGTIQWYASAGDGEGNTRSTSTYNLSTVAVPITATPTAPIDTVETANTPTVFTWRNSGTITIYPTAAQLQYSTDNINWTDFGSVTGSAATYTAAAGALPSGQLFWRVRVKNVDDVWGSWSDPVTFSNFGAPSVSQVLADDKPFTTITWTSSTQQAYRITIDGSVVYGTYWGANVHAFTLPLPLADGAHTAAVEVQNEYGQWSQPAQTDFTVTNVPGSAVSLSRSVDIDAELYWSGGAGTGDFAVYRDGVRIARTGQQAFTDRLCLGEHEYFVLELLQDGYYTKSNVVTAEIFVPVPQIALLSGGPWIPMEKCLEISRRYTRKREKALTHYRGLTLPVVEWGSFWDESVELSVFYEYGQQADRFAALCGNTVVIKEPDGRMMVGALSELPEDAKAFHRFFTFTGDSVEWEDLADGTQS